MKNSRADVIMRNIIREAQAQHYPENKPKSWNEHNFHEDKGFLFLGNNTAVIRLYRALPDELSAAEKSMMLDCTQFIEKETGMLYYRSDREHVPMSVTALANRLRLSARHVYRLVSRMCELRVMAREQGRIYVNPLYFFRGRYLSHHLYALFRTDLQVALPSWVVERYEGKRGS